MKRHLVLFAKIGLAAGLLTWLISSGVKSGELNLADLTSVQSRWPWLLAAFAIFGVVLLLGTARWRLLLRSQGIHYSFHDVYALTMIGFFFSQVLPGSVGGDLMKAYVVMTEQKERRSAALISVIFDRAFGLFMLLVVALAAVPFSVDLLRADPEIAAVAGLVLAVFLSAICASWLFYSERIRSHSWVQAALSRLPFKQIFSRLGEALYAYKRFPRTLWIAALISIALHVLVILMMVCLTKALIGGSLPISSFFFLVPLANIAMAIPITPAGWGTGEAAYQYLLKRVGIDQGLVICLLMRCVHFGWALVGCAYYLKRRGRVASAVKDGRQSYDSESTHDHGAARNHESEHDDDESVASERAPEHSPEEEQLISHAGVKALANAPGE